MLIYVPGFEGLGDIAHSTPTTTTTTKNKKPRKNHISEQISEIML